MRLSSLGGIIRFTAGIYIVYFLGLLELIYMRLGEARELVGKSETLSDVEAVLDVTTSDVMTIISSNLTPLGIAALAWIIGGLMLSTGWDEIRSKWPGRVKLLYSILVYAVYALLVLSIAYPALRAVGSAGVVEAMSRSMESTWSLLILQYAFALPLTLPLVRALLAVRYSSMKGLAGALLVLGGVIYLVGAYQVYSAIRPFSVVREHLHEIISSGLTDRGLMELTIVTLEVSQLTILRVNELVKILALASLLYGLAFAYIAYGGILRSMLIRLLARRPLGFPKVKAL